MRLNGWKRALIHWRPRLTFELTIWCHSIVQSYSEIAFMYSGGLIIRDSPQSCNLHVHVSYLFRGAVNVTLRCLREMSRCLCAN